MKNNPLIDFVTAGLPKVEVSLASGQKILVRSMAVKELKVLMLSNTSNSGQDFQTLQVIKSCILTEGVDVLKLCSLDIELIFLSLYKLSKGNSNIPVQYRCSNEVDDEGTECGELINANINLDTVTTDEIPDNKITLSNGLILTMRLPNLVEREYFSDQEVDIFDLAIRCIDTVDTGSEVFKNGEDISEEELHEVIDFLTEESYEKLLDYVSSIPTVRVSFPLKCSKCGYEEILTLRGLGDFFM